MSFRQYVPPVFYVKRVALAMSNLRKDAAINFQVELRHFERHGAKVAVRDAN